MSNIEKSAAAKAIVHEDGLSALADKYYGKVMRMWHIKKIFTPYEQASKFIDQSTLESDIADEVFITGIYNINGRILIEYADIASFDSNFVAPDGRIICRLYDNDNVEFAFLDEINLAYYKHDTDDFLTDGIICLTPNDIPEGSYMIKGGNDER